MMEVEVIADAATAAMVLDPVKSRLLHELAEPASAASLAARLGIARQNVNYHLRLLEERRLVSVAQERVWGGITERLFRASAASYVISPLALGHVAADPARAADRLSAGYLIAVAARIVREVGELWQRAKGESKRLATLAMDAEIRFRSSAERAAFTAELTTAIATLVAKYHDPGAENGRSHRLVVAAHPLPGAPAGAVRSPRH